MTGQSDDFYCTVTNDSLANIFGSPDNIFIFLGTKQNCLFSDLQDNNDISVFVLNALVYTPVIILFLVLIYENKLYGNNQ